MLRECNLDEISDGKKYSINDMVKADCDDCKGCSACCHGMGSSIVLDPLDVHRLMSHFHTRFEVLLEDKIELNIVDGVILPNLKMNTQAEGEPCVFLDAEGRCSIHEDRPGICRIFPLGRVYENNSFSYILQIHECQKENRSKVKVSKWIDTPDLKKNQQFITDWHYFLKAAQARLAAGGEEELIKRIAMQILQYFYIEPYHTDCDFYEQFDKRLIQMKKLAGID
ncbi:MAG: YkgJ family cysteine cluster protein [Roseburia sp.]|nr:YkgJ family cysteine cluster protein [Roseburia sp.]